MADAAISGGGEMELEQQQRPEKSGAGLLGAESNRAGAAEDATQNGGRSEGSGGGEALLVAAVAAEDKGPPNLSITSGSQRRSSVSAAPEQQQQQPPPSDALGGSPPLPKPPEDVPVRRNFQIPRKSREKKGCAFPFPPFSPSFLSSSYSLGRIFMRLTQLHVKFCGCIGGCGMPRTDEAARDMFSGIRQASTFFFLPTAPFFPIFILSQGGTNQTNSA